MRDKRRQSAARLAPTREQTSTHSARRDDSLGRQHGMPSFADHACDTAEKAHVARRVNDCVLVRESMGASTREHLFHCAAALSLDVVYGVMI